MNTGLIFQDNPLFFLKRIFMLESQKMLPSRQQAFCFFACLPEREHITLILKQMRQPLYAQVFFYAQVFLQTGRSWITEMIIQHFFDDAVTAFKKGTDLGVDDLP